MKCPMKFADGSRRASQTECEREDCAWWIRIAESVEGWDGETGGCAVAAIGWCQANDMVIRWTESHS